MISSAMEEIRFNFEELEVWLKSVDFANEVINAIDETTLSGGHKHYRVVEQLEAACTSVALNIAEGRGRNTKKEFIQFLFIARGSLFETITLLVIFQRNKWITEDQLRSLRQVAFRINKMIMSLISSLKKQAG